MLILYNFVLLPFALRFWSKGFLLNNKNLLLTLNPCPLRSLNVCWAGQISHVCSVIKKVIYIPKYIRTYMLYINCYLGCDIILTINSVTFFYQQTILLLELFVTCYVKSVLPKRKPNFNLWIYVHSSYITVYYVKWYKYLMKMRHTVSVSCTIFMYFMVPEIITRCY